MIDALLNFDKIEKINLGIVSILNVFSFAYLFSLNYSLIRGLFLFFSLSLLAFSINYFSVFATLLNRNVRLGKIKTEKDIQEFSISVFKKTPFLLMLVINFVLSLSSVILLIINPIQLISYIILIIYSYLLLYMVTRGMMYILFQEYFK